MNKKRGLLTILISSLVALITSIYLLYQHYSPESSFCNISKEISCDIVNKSVYSEIFGVPLALLSILMFSFIFMITISVLTRRKLFGLSKNNVFNIIFWLMLLSVFFVLYLLYIEVFVLYSLCLLCILLDIIILIILTAIISLRKYN